jgi:hypothetical protein
MAKATSKYCENLPKILPMYFAKVLVLFREILAKFRMKISRNSTDNEEMRNKREFHEIIKLKSKRKLLESKSKYVNFVDRIPVRITFKIRRDKQ